MTLQDHVAAVFDAAHRCERAYVELCGNPTSHEAQSDHHLARQQLDHALNALADHCRARDCEIERLSLDLREAQERYDDIMQKALGAAQ